MAQIGLSQDGKTIMIRLDYGKPSEQTIELTIDAAAIMSQQLAAAVQGALARNAPPKLFDAQGRLIRRH